jgi:hypothetical protein
MEAFVSETTLGRALEFMKQPQDVEVHRGGCWVAGVMVGWRQEEGSSCRVMVRIAEGGVERTAWADLHDVRLAEHHSYPPTESLPFIPRLPQGTTWDMTRSEAGGGWSDLHGVSDFLEPVTPWAPRADAATERTSTVTATVDASPSDTGRHRASARIRHEGIDRTVREYEAGGAPASWSPSSGEPSSLHDEVEPTRLLTLPAPHHWKAAVPATGVFRAR